MPLLRTLPPFLLGRWRLGFEPGFDGGILREEVGHVRDEILDDREVWQWIDPYRPFNIADRLSACDRVGAVDIHRAAAADLSLSETHARIYWWCSPPKTGTANV